jgi:alkanesulfonate monooxygenase SsuD/methylene tetrahydromethanopterin reductase-like flavin-dependent oxidoreductase (luciferase family)
MIESGTRPLKIGLLMPYMEGLGSGHFADYTRRWPERRGMALRAEALGLDSVWVADHLLFR